MTLQTETRSILKQIINLKSFNSVFKMVKAPKSQVRTRKSSNIDNSEIFDTQARTP